MDENTKHIVASNLTVAYCANRPETTEEKIIEVYGRFLELIATPVKTVRPVLTQSAAKSSRALK